MTRSRQQELHLPCHLTNNNRLQTGDREQLRRGSRRTPAISRRTPTRKLERAPPSTPGCTALSPSPLDLAGILTGSERRQPVLKIQTPADSDELPVKLVASTDQLRPCHGVLNEAGTPL